MKTVYLLIGFCILFQADLYSMNINKDKSNTSDSLLSIELTLFTGNKIDNFVNNLKWTMVSEVNCDYFIIERTIDGIQFEELGKVNGGGNSTDLHDYSYQDRGFSNEINYYRLKEVDFDGNYSYSELISIDNRSNGDKEIISKINLQGIEVDNSYSGIILLIYSDKTSKKSFQ